MDNNDWVSQNHEKPYTLHIVLATIPMNKHDVYLKSMESEFYDSYIKKNEEYCIGEVAPYLYRPIKYYMFGNYDVAFLSIIDSFKFAQKLFIPDGKSDDIYNPNSFQIITGICLDHSGVINEKDLNVFFHDNLLSPSLANQPLFLSIINLKLNNGTLIGNGNLLLKNVVAAVKCALESLTVENGIRIEYIILQSFSWYEISLICFLDDIKSVAIILKKLRELTITSLHTGSETNIYENSLYYISDKNYENDPAEGSDRSELINIFSDTQTYLGIDYTKVSNVDNHDLIQTLRSMCVQTEIEWQVKPGHFGNLLEILEKLDLNTSSDQDVKFPSAFLLTGKSDYLMPTYRTNLADSVFLIRYLYNTTNDVFLHARKIKTSVLLPAELKKPIKGIEIPSYQPLIKYLGITNDKVNEINKNLKELKISRQLRNKIKKIYYNYNNGIQDHVLLPYFLDFYGFISALEYEINVTLNPHDEPNDEQSEENSEYDLGNSQRVFLTEKKLRKFIRVFEEGHKVRTLNSYQFEDINDFDLDFNTSIQQLLSIYNSLILEISNLFYSEYTYAPVVQLTWNDTVANAVSVNYNIHHLLYPEFVFSTITKEILNQYKVMATRKRLLDSDGQILKIITLLEKDFNNALIKHPYLKDYKNANLIDFNNLIIDAIRFIFTFNYDYELFKFWFWTYDFQNSALYSNKGYLEEVYFKTELFRFIFLSSFYGYHSEVVEETCPIPEIQSYWSRYYFKTKESVLFLLQTDNLITKIKKLVVDVLEKPIARQLLSEGNDIATHWKNSFNIETSNIEYFEDRLIKVIGNLGGRDMQKFWPLIERNACIQYFDRFLSSKMEAGHCIYYEEKLFRNSNMFLCAYMYSYLKIIASCNNYQVKLLRRDWTSGLPLNTFIQNETDKHLYSIDPMGGIFFSTQSGINKYFGIRNALLKSLWHFSQLQKQRYIKYIISKK